MKAADVGIDAGGGDGERSFSSSSSDDERSPRGRRFLSARAFTRITYVHIHECDDFSVRASVFLLQKMKMACLSDGFSPAGWRWCFADRRVLLPGGRDAAAARPPADGGAEQAALRLHARQLVRLGHRAVLRPKKG